MANEKKKKIVRVNERSKKYRTLVTIAEDLLKITAGCREDMHEPDEQGLSAKVSGRVLDNAGVDREYRVVLSREDEKGRVYQDTFNLADLLALARIGADR